MEHERRNNFRLDLTLTVFYQVKKPLTALIVIGDEKFEARMLNLSQGGMALLTHYDIPAGTVLSIQFTLVDMDKHSPFSLHGPMKITGQVRSNILVRSNEHRLGVCFTQIDSRDKAVITNFVNALLTSGPII